MIRKVYKLFGNKKDLRVKKDLDSLKNKVMDSFSHLKTDMEEQKKWVEHLHSSHKELNNVHAMLDRKHEHHQEVHAKDIDNINAWIDHLHDNIKDQDKYMKELERNVSNAFERYNKYLVDLYKIMADRLGQDENMAVHGRPSTRLDASTAREGANDKRHPAALENHEVVHAEEGREEGTGPEKYEQATRPLSHYSDILTRSEKKVLAELCKTEMKLSYKDLAMVLGISPNTAKNHICHIRNKGFPIKEIDDSKGIKRYFVPDNTRKILLSKNV